jgi:hypothetical protein
MVGKTSVLKQCLIVEASGGIIEFGGTIPRLCDVMGERDPFPCGTAPRRLMESQANLLVYG